MKKTDLELCYTWVLFMGLFMILLENISCFPSWVFGASKGQYRLCSGEHGAEDFDEGKEWKRRS